MFMDANKREFAAVLVLPTVSALRNLGVNLALDLSEVLQQIQADPELLANVLWIVHQASAESHGLTDEAFGRILDGDTLAAAVESLIEAIVNFSPPVTRVALRKLVDKGREVERAAARQMEAVIGSLRPETILSALSGSVGNVPESPDLIPPTGLSASLSGQPEPSVETNGTDSDNS